MNNSLLQSSGNSTGFVGELLGNFGIPPELAGAIGSAVVFVVVTAVLYLAGKSILVPVIDGLLRKRAVETHVRQPIRLLVYLGSTFVAVGVGFALAGFGNILLALATVGAAATLAVGFALQNVIQNFVAGAFIYTDEPFRTGDWIEWEDHSGFVEEISLRVTRVRTFDNEHLTVPNSQLTDGVIKNYDRNKTLRLKFTFRISFRDDIDKAADIILEEARARDGILNDPEPSVKLIEINESSFGLQSRIWIQNPGQSDFLGIRGQFVQAVTERFEQEGVTIPYPHRTIDGSVQASQFTHTETPPDN